MSTKPLSQLLDTQDPALPLIKEWMRSARNSAEVLPVERSQGEQTLLTLQVTTRSPLGALAYETGGILIDDGWLRFLGAGSDRMTGNLVTWNGFDGNASVTILKGAMVVAHDAVGGFFAINGGAFKGESRNIFYLAPDTLAWEDLQRSYSDFLRWALQGDLERFYQNARWSGWRNDVKKVHGDQGISIYPPLWANGGPLETRSRRVVPMLELWDVNLQGLPKSSAE